MIEKELGIMNCRDGDSMKRQLLELGVVQDSKGIEYFELRLMDKDEGEWRSVKKLRFEASELFELNKYILRGCVGMSEREV